MTRQQRIAIDNGQRIVAIGDRVGFKCDIEQTGVVVEINVRRGTIVLESQDGQGFDGDYIGGMRQTEEDADRCW